MNVFAGMRREMLREKTTSKKTKKKQAVMSVQNQPGPWQSWEPLRVSVKQLAGVEEDTMCATVPSPWSPTARRRRSTFPHQQFPRVLLLRHRRPEEERVVGVKKKKKMAGREYLNHKKKEKKSKKEGGRLSSVSSTWFTWVHIKDENFSSSQYTFQCVLTFICRKNCFVLIFNYGYLKLIEVERGACSLINAAMLIWSRVGFFPNEI